MVRTAPLVSALLCKNGPFNEVFEFLISKDPISAENSLIQLYFNFFYIFSHYILTFFWKVRNSKKEETQCFDTSIVATRYFGSRKRKQGHREHITRVLFHSPPQKCYRLHFLFFKPFDMPYLVVANVFIITFSCIVICIAMYFSFSFYMVNLKLLGILGLHKIYIFRRTEEAFEKKFTPLLSYQLPLLRDQQCWTKGHILSFPFQKYTWIE